MFRQRPACPDCGDDMRPCPACEDPDEVMAAHEARLPAARFADLFLAGLAKLQRLREKLASAAAELEALRLAWREAHTLRPMDRPPPHHDWVHAWARGGATVPDRMYWCEHGRGWVGPLGVPLPDAQSYFAGWTPIVQPQPCEARQASKQSAPQGAPLAHCMPTIKPEIERNA